jgi:hypothetical protein
MLLAAPSIRFSFSLQQAFYPSLPIRLVPSSLLQPISLYQSLSA